MSLEKDNSAAAGDFRTMDRKRTGNKRKRVKFEIDSEKEEREEKRRSKVSEEKKEKRQRDRKKGDRKRRFSGEREIDREKWKKEERREERRKREEREYWRQMEKDYSYVMEKAEAKKVTKWFKRGAEWVLAVDPEYNKTNDCLWKCLELHGMVLPRGRTRGTFTVRGTRLERGVQLALDRVGMLLIPLSTIHNGVQQITDKELRAYAVRSEGKHTDDSIVHAMLEGDEHRAQVGRVCILRDARRGETIRACVVGTPREHSAMREEQEKKEAANEAM